MNEAPNPIVTRLVWSALIVSQCIYLVIAGPADAPGPPPIFMVVLGVVAVSEGLFVLAIFRLGLVARVQRGDLDPSTVEGAGRFFTGLIICWVLIESIAIYGLVLRFLGASLVDTAPFVLGAFVLMALTHPWQAGLRPPVDSRTRGEDSTPIG